MDTLKENYKFYDLNRDAINAGHIGEYVLIRDRAVAGYFKDEDGVYAALKGAHVRPGSVMIHRCLPEAEDFVDAGTAPVTPRGSPLTFPKAPLYNHRVDILSDASAVLAIILNEPNKETVIALTRDAVVFVPEMIRFEVGNALIKLYKRKMLAERQIGTAYEDFTRLNLWPLDVHVERALAIAAAHNIYAYDAYYLEIAERLRIPLMTFDRKMAEIARNMGIGIVNET